MRVTAHETLAGVARSAVLLVASSALAQEPRPALEGLRPLAGERPVIGNAAFAVTLDDPHGALGVPPGTLTIVVVSDAVQTAARTTAVWQGPGLPAVHPLPIPPWPELAGQRILVQGFFAGDGELGSALATNRLELVLELPPADGALAPASSGAAAGPFERSGAPVLWPGTGDTPDPTLLPVATIAQGPLLAAYNALGVPSLPAGGSYADPTTGVTVHKLTSATFPASGFRWGHAYAEGGDEVSLPYDGATRAVHVYTSNGSHWLIDFTPGQGVSNPRQLTGALAVWGDLGLTFSNDPDTPWYVYTSTQSGSAIRRFDLRTMAEAPGDGWPVTGETQASWLHQSEDDGFFVWMRGANGSTVVGYEPSTLTKKTYTNTSLNEPRVDRAGRYVGISMDTPQNALLVWDWLADTITWSTNGSVPFAHVASLRHRWLGVDWNQSYPPDFTAFTPDVPGSVAHVGGPANATLVHGSGNWIQHPPNGGDPDDQWAVFLHYGSLKPAGEYWLAPGGMVLMTPGGERRLLAHAYNTSSTYTFYSFAKLSSDGRYVLFTSDMNGSPRSDLFLAELPR